MKNKQGCRTYYMARKPLIIIRNGQKIEIPRADDPVPSAPQTPQDIAFTMRCFEAAQKALPYGANNTVKPKRIKGSTIIAAAAIACNLSIIGYLAWDIKQGDQTPVTGHDAELTELEPNLPNSDMVEDDEPVLTEQAPEIVVEPEAVEPAIQIPVIVEEPAVEEPAVEEDGASSLARDEAGRLLESPRPRLRPEFLLSSLVIPHDTIQAYGFHEASEYAALGCGSARGFDEFWVAGLDHTPFFMAFVDDYRERLQLPDRIHNNSLNPHKRSLQLMLGLNHCYDQINHATYDSSIGPQTIAAIARFQDVNGLEQTGRADEQTMSLLIHASAMRVMYNMHVLDITARAHGLETQGVFQKAWHESFYNHRAVSYTGADGIGQMIDSTFLEEIRQIDPDFYREYRAAEEEGGERLAAAEARLDEMQHDLWIGANAMMTHCRSLLDRFNRESCAEVYGAYQLGRSGYARLIRAASDRPHVAASSVTRGTATNGYGHMRADNALDHVNRLINAETDQQRALQDIRFLERLRQQRAYMIGPQMTAQTRGIVNHFKIDG